MPETGGPPRSQRYQPAVTSCGFPTWRLAGADDRSPFFFSWRVDEANRAGGWGEQDSPYHPDRESRLARQVARRRPLVATLLAETLGERAFQGDDLDDRDLAVCRTRLHDRTKRQSHPDRFIDSSCMPYVTLSIGTTFRSTSVHLGDHTTVFAPRTGGVVHAIVGDDRHISGAEPSLHLSESLGLRPGDPCCYLIFPQSGLGQGLIPSLAAIHSRGEALYKRSPVTWAKDWGIILGDYFVESIESSRHSLAGRADQ
jgi:hypothetical protein